MSNLFDKRHFEWLAKWAGEHLTEPQIKQFSIDLLHTNTNYNATKFLHAALDHMHKHQLNEHKKENGK